jgi:hypothetical protein
MISRCYHPQNPAFKNYGGRGIRVCRRWRDFKIFLKDMGEHPHGLMIERKNNNGNYSKENCIWTTRHVQNRNKRVNFRITAFGQTKIITDWAKELGCSRGKIKSRLQRGFSAEAALTAPRQKSGPKRVGWTVPANVEKEVLKQLSEF